MKHVTIKDGSGELAEVLISDEVYEEMKQARRSEMTQRRIDRTWLAREELSDYHTHILMCPERLMSDVVEENILIEQMLRCLGTLSDYEQVLIHRHFFEGESFRSIAKDIGVSWQTIQRRVNRSVKGLSRMMGFI